MAESIYWGTYLKFQAPGTGTSYDSGGAINAGVTNFEANAGKVQSCIRLGGTPGKWGNGAGGFTAFSVMQAAVDPIIAHGTLPISDWAPWDWANPSANYSFRLQAINAGTWDASLTTWFTAAAAWGKPLLLRPMWEENWYNQFPWQYHDTTGSWNIGTGLGWGGIAGWTNVKSDFVSAWQRIVGIAQTCGAREGYGNGHIQFVWAPNRQANTDNAFSTLTPGDAYIDWYSCDSYPDLPSTTIGQAQQGQGPLNYIRNAYSELTALSASKPYCITESAWYGAQGTALAPTSINSNGSVWTIVVPASPTPGGNGWAATNGIKLSGQTPSAYIGQWTIASVTGTGPWTITVTSAVNPGAASVVGTAQLIDDIARDASITADLETNFPAMTRLKAWTTYQVSNQNESFEFSPDDANARNSRTWASFKAHLNGHYLAGGQMPSLASRLWLPFQDQPMVTAGFERLIATHRSVPGLVGLWLNNEPSGSVITDYSSGARNGAVTGAITLNDANVVLSQPAWGSISFPGSAGNNVSVADNAAFSPATTGKFTIVLSYYCASNPATQSTLISKIATVNQEWEVFITSAGHLLCVFHQIGGGTFSNWDHTLATVAPVGAPRWAAFTLDTSNVSVPGQGYTDYLGMGTPLAFPGSTGPMADGTAAINFGQRADATNPAVTGIRLGHVALYNTQASAESLAECLAAWIAAPVISAISAAIGSVTFTTDIGGSSQIEYGPTVAYGSLSALDPTRPVGARTVSAIPGFSPGSHYRILSRNPAGTLQTGTDQGGGAGVAWFT